MKTPIRQLPVRFRRITPVQKVVAAMRDNPAFEDFFGDTPFRPCPPSYAASGMQENERIDVVIRLAASLRKL